MRAATLRHKHLRNAEETRAAILQAAVEVFSHEGAAGARTDEIAKRAGVNKALLYYYFKDKDALHAAVLDLAMGHIVPKLMAAIDSARDPRRQLMAYVDAHFDAIAANPVVMRIMQHELMRAREGGASHLRLIVERYHKPLSARIQQIIANGIEQGQFRPVDPRHTTLSIAAIVIFYFMSAPVLRLLTGSDPYSERALEERRAAIHDFIASSLFLRRERRNAAAAVAQRERKKGRASERKK